MLQYGGSESLLNFASLHCILHCVVSLIHPAISEYVRARFSKEIRTRCVADAKLCARYLVIFLQSKHESTNRLLMTPHR